MEILKIIVFEYMFGYILQGFIFTLGISAFNRKKIIFRKYTLVSIVLSVFIILVRLLPISFGVHTILNLLFLFMVCVLILKMPIYTTIRSTLLVTVFLLISEMANIGVMIKFLGQSEFNRRMEIPAEKAIMGLPGALTFALLVFLSYVFLANGKKDNKTIAK